MRWQTGKTVWGCVQRLGYVVKCIIQGFDYPGIHKVLAENERHVKDVQNRAIRQLGIRSTLAARMRCSVVLRKSLGERRCDTFRMPQPQTLTLMINFKKLKSQIHKGGIGYVFEPTVRQIEESDYEIFPVRIDGSKRRAIRAIVEIIHMKNMPHWRKEFML